MMQAIKAREVAWRVFAHEFNASNHEHTEGGEKAANYIITPLGAKVNRLYVVGVLTDLENIGDEQPMWKARISDPTGTFFLTAGQYQAEAAQALSRMKPPAFVALIGKARLYSPEESVVYTSVRPEIIKKVGASERDYWMLEACNSLSERLGIVREAMKLEEVTKEKLKALGCRDAMADGILLALQHYKNVDLEEYGGVLADALRFLIEGGAEEDEEGPVIPAPMPQSGLETEKEDEEKEATILELVSSLDRDGKGAVWKDVISGAKKKGIKEDELEELVNNMQEDGKLYEPVLGKLKKA